MVCMIRASTLHLIFTNLTTVEKIVNYIFMWPMMADAGLAACNIRGNQFETEEMDGYKLKCTRRRWGHLVISQCGTLAGNERFS